MSPLSAVGVDKHHPPQTIDAGLRRPLSDGGGESILPTPPLPARTTTVGEIASFEGRRRAARPTRVGEEGEVGNASSKASSVSHTGQAELARKLSGLGWATTTPAGGTEGPSGGQACPPWDVRSRRSRSDRPSGSSPRVGGPSTAPLRAAGCRAAAHRHGRAAVRGARGSRRRAGWGREWCQSRVDSSSQGSASGSDWASGSGSVRRFCR